MSRTRAQNLVLDASVVLDLILNRPLALKIRTRIRKGRNLLAPNLLDAEVGQVLRKFVLRGEIAEERGRWALQDFLDLPIHRYPHAPLLKRSFDWKQNLTVYDSLYLALTEATQSTLLTCDRALSQAGGHTAQVDWIS